MLLADTVIRFLCPVPYKDFPSLRDFNCDLSVSSCGLHVNISLTSNEISSPHDVSKYPLGHSNDFY